MRDADRPPIAMAPAASPDSFAIEDAEEAFFAAVAASISFAVMRLEARGVGVRQAPAKVSPELNADVRQFCRLDNSAPNVPLRSREVAEGSFVLRLTNSPRRDPAAKLKSDTPA